jgi:hypothetical protein
LVGEFHFSAVRKRCDPLVIWHFCFLLRETKSEVDAGQNSFLKVSEAAFLFD